MMLNRVQQLLLSRNIFVRFLRKLYKLISWRKLYYSAHHNLDLLIKKYRKKFNHILEWETVKPEIQLFNQNLQLTISFNNHH